jgi:uncharacterized protein YbbC (DUF1343 family)
MDRRGFLRTTAVVGLGSALPACDSDATARAGATAGPVTREPSARPDAAAAPATPETPEEAAGPGRVRTGFEELAAGGYALVRGQRVGMLANPTAVTRDLRHEVDVMHASGEVDLVAALGPEHGFRGSAGAGGSEGGYRDPRTGLRVYDTYGRGPAQIAAFYRDAGLDAVLFDIQDVGARFYTYIWSMYDAMVAASRAGVRFVVLDRPNPIGGRDAHGPVLHREHASFVGRRPIAQQHGMTVGELAGLFNAEFLPRDRAADGPADLAVSAMRGWSRGMFADETGQPWVMPSPNMPRLETAVVYPGTGMFEGTNISEGRGTTRPFELVGAPYLGHRWVEALRRLDLPGVDFREAYFEPTESKYRGRTCAGVQLHVRDREAFDPIRTGVAMLVAARRTHPGEFGWRESSPPYLIDALTGSARVRRAVDAGASTDEVVGRWRGELERFRRVRARHLLYPTRPSGAEGGG